MARRYNEIKGLANFTAKTIVSDLTISAEIRIKP